MCGSHWQLCDYVYVCVYICVLRETDRDRERRKGAGRQTERQIGSADTEDASIDFSRCPST